MEQYVGINAQQPSPLRGLHRNGDFGVGRQGDASVPTHQPNSPRPYADRHTVPWFVVEAGDNPVSILETSTGTKVLSGLSISISRDMVSITGNKKHPGFDCPRCYCENSLISFFSEYYTSLP
jgi:hypothetical protein